MSAVVNQTLHLQQISDSGACAAYFLEMQRSNRALALPSSALCSRLSAGQVGWSSGASRLPAIPWRRKGKGDSGTWEDRLKGKTLINHGIVALALLQFLSKLLAYRCPMYNTPTLSTASCSPQQRLSDVQNMAGISPRKRLPAFPQHKAQATSSPWLVKSGKQVEPTAYRRAQQIGARSEASETSQSPQRQWQVEPLTANSTKARPWRQQVQEKPATLGDDSIAATSGSARDSLRGLAAERDRLQRQVQEMRSDVSNTRQDWRQGQKVQTEELRGTLQDLQAEAQRLQTEQRRQAAALKGSLKAPDPAANMRLEKQVEGVVSIVKGQEERFERLETDITSAYESQRKQLQQALAENRQLAKGLEEDSMRRQNMMAELMEKVTRNSAVNQLSSELANASTVIQDLSSKSVTGLANEMKADRESRALECASNRVEVVKMVEDARRQGAMEAMGLHDQGGVPDLYLPAGAEAMISRPGILAVHNLVDINCKILRDMEDQLVIRAGFIAGVFHTWRFQANLMKTGRQFEDGLVLRGLNQAKNQGHGLGASLFCFTDGDLVCDIPKHEDHFHDIQDQWSAELQAHRRTFEDQLATAAEKAAAHKEHVRQQHDLLLRQWMLGDAKGMYTSIWRAWSGYVIKDGRLLVYRVSMPWFSFRVRVSGLIFAEVQTEQVDSLTGFSTVSRLPGVGDSDYTSKPDAPFFFASSMSGFVQEKTRLRNAANIKKAWALYTRTSTSVVVVGFVSSGSSGCTSVPIKDNRFSSCDQVSISSFICTHQQLGHSDEKVFVDAIEVMVRPILDSAAMCELLPKNLACRYSIAHLKRLRDQDGSHFGVGMCGSCFLLEAGIVERIHVGLGNLRLISPPASEQQVVTKEVIEEAAREVEKCLGEVEESSKQAKEAAKQAVQVAEKCRQIEEETKKLIEGFHNND
eukprot:s1835_g6.t1